MLGDLGAGSEIMWMVFWGGEEVEMSESWLGGGLGLREREIKL